LSAKENVQFSVEGLEELNEYIKQLQVALKLEIQLGARTGIGSGSRSTTPKKKQEMDTLIKALRQVRANRDISLQDLPTVNRDVRMLLGQLPGMRTAFSYWFQLRRTVRGAELLQAAPALRGRAQALAYHGQEAEAAKLTNIAAKATVGGVAALAATVLFLGMEVDAIRRDVKSQEDQYRDFISTYRTDLDKTGIDEMVEQSRNWYEKMWSWFSR